MTLAQQAKPVRPHSRYSPEEDAKREEMRNRIMDALLDGPATAEEVGLMINHPPSGLSGYLNGLENDGLVEAVGLRKVDGYKSVIVFAMKRTTKGVAA